MPSTKTNNTILGIIFMTVFIDMLGVSIVIPVIPGLFFGESSQFFAASVTEDTRSILYGLLVAAFPLMQFFGAPILGALSDKHGRKPLLTASLIGTMLGYIIFAIGILSQNIWLLFFGRMLPGFMGGNISIVYSAIADLSEAKDKAKNFGLIGAAFGLGFILGPAIGGILSDNNVVSWFSHATPFWLTATLTFINLVLIKVFFPETLKEKKTSQLSLFTGIRNVGKSFTQANLRSIFSVVLLLAIGFAFFTQFFSVLLIQTYGFSESSIGYLYGWVGLWLVITQGFLVRRLSGRVAPATILTFSIIALAFTIGAIPIMGTTFWFYVLNALVAIAYGLTSPNLTAIVSEQVSAKEQGEILGINQSMQSLGTTIPPLIAGYLNTLNSSFPLLSGAALCLFSWMVFVFIFKKKKPKSKKH